MTMDTSQWPEHKVIVSLLSVDCATEISCRRYEKSNAAAGTFIIKVDLNKFNISFVELLSFFCWINFLQVTRLLDWTTQLRLDFSNRDSYLGTFEKEVSNSQAKEYINESIIDVLN